MTVVTSLFWTVVTPGALTTLPVRVSEVVFSPPPPTDVSQDQRALEEELLSGLLASKVGVPVTSQSPTWSVSDPPQQVSFDQVWLHMLLVSALSRR